MKIIENIEEYNGKKYYELAGIIKNKLDDKLENKVILNEYIAFQLYVDYDKLSNWGTNYGPYMTLRNDDGTFTESPGKNYITSETIEYWKTRAKETKNVFLKFRYLDIVYDLEENITGDKVDYKNIINLIETGIKAIKQRVFTDLDGKDILKRLLSIIISINKVDEYRNIFQIIIDY